MSDKVIIEVNGLKIKENSLYKVVDKPDLNAVDGLREHGSTKVPLEFMGNSVQCRYDVANRVFDTGFYTQSPCYSNMDRELREQRVRTLREKLVDPYELVHGIGKLDNKNEEFWLEYEYTVFEGKIFNTEDVNDLLALYIAMLGFELTPKELNGDPRFRNAQFCIEDKEVNFENAWGICDEDLYKQSIKYADKSTKENKPFFQFVMTTSNHKPYTFPNGKIDLPQGDRDAAVKYTDYALGQFIATAKTKPWFKNTVFLIVADHCASSAGKWEINIAKHHIPAIIYNLNHTPEKIDRLTSQIDLMPTLFGYLNWNYNTSLYGKDINQTKPGEERAFLGNYRTLGLLKNNIFTQIDDRKRVKQFNVTGADQSLSEVKSKNNNLVTETISYYQTASERFKNGKMKQK
ncbi:MAG: hypothetical protein DI622_10245 [Chryseobacterium sp.]|nr:MAG: hypothetical protein DI622_10245 [Chryseobacterium sp.]